MIDGLILSDLFWKLFENNTILVILSHNVPDRIVINIIFLADLIPRHFEYFSAVNNVYSLKRGYLLIFHV